MFAFIERLNGGEMIAVIAILSGAGVVALGILVSGWNSATAARQQVDLKRDMLARGLSVQEIEQLTMSESARHVQMEYDHSIREAQVAADLKRDLVARGLPIEQVAQVNASAADVGVLAETICAGRGRHPRPQGRRPADRDVPEARRGSRHRRPQDRGQSRPVNR